MLELVIIQFKHLRSGAQGFGGLFALNQAAHLHFTGGDHAQADAHLAEPVKQLGGNSRSPHDPGPANAEFGQPALHLQLTAFAQVLAAEGLSCRQLSLRQGEGDVIAAAVVGGLHDQVDVQASSAEPFKQASGHPGFIGYMGQGHHGLAFQQFRPVHGLAQLQTFAANPPARLTEQARAWLVAPTGSHDQRHAVVSGDFHRPWVQNSRTQAGQLQHFIAAHLSHQLGFRHLAGIGGQHTRHVGVDLTGIGSQCCG